jgi:hypothetical protein
MECIYQCQSVSTLPENVFHCTNHQLFLAYSVWSVLCPFKCNIASVMDKSRNWQLLRQMNQTGTHAATRLHQTVLSSKESLRKVKRPDLNKNDTLNLRFIHLWAWSGCDWFMTNKKEINLNNKVTFCAWWKYLHVITLTSCICMWSPWQSVSVCDHPDSLYLHVITLTAYKSYSTASHQHLLILEREQVRE